jgi:AraC-like DNA-binding protein
VLGPLVSDAFLNRATHSDILRDQFAIRIIRSGETVREDCRASPSRAIVRSTSEIDLAKGVPIAQGASHSAGARKPEADGLILLFLIRGEAEYAQNGPSQTLIPGDAIVLNRGKADSLAASEGELECLAMCVSKAKITRALAKKVADGPLFLSRDSLAAQILSGYVRSYFAASQERCDPAIDRLFCAHVSDLLTLAVESSARAVGPSAARNAKSDRLRAILAEIAANACEPGFCTQTVARKIGLSERYIRQLLEETAKTFSRHVSERRLDHALELLTDPASKRLSVTDIAMMSGSRDISHFNRSFRRRFGYTPSEARQKNVS